MNTSRVKELAAARAKVAALEAQLGSALAGLPAKYGFADAASFVAAVEAANGQRRGRKPGKPAAGAESGGRKRRKRAVITDAMRAEVKKLVQAGKSGAEIAKVVGISLPSVQNIKKALGLVKNRK